MIRLFFAALLVFSSVAYSGENSLGTAPLRSYRPAWGTVRFVVPLETVVVPRRDKLRLHLVREARPPRVFTRRAGYGSAGN